MGAYVRTYISQLSADIEMFLDVVCVCSVRVNTVC